MELDEIILKIKQLIVKIEQKKENIDSGTINTLKDSETLNEVLKTTDQLLEKVVDVLEDKNKD
tara:strand:+ start:1940 stop:2128 length:189 start_codon:yes stop_codon:yes gene_type:complete